MQVAVIFPAVVACRTERPVCNMGLLHNVNAQILPTRNTANKEEMRPVLALPLQMYDNHPLDATCSRSNMTLKAWHFLNKISWNSS